MICPTCATFPYRWRRHYCTTDIHINARVTTGSLKRTFKSCPDFTEAQLDSGGAPGGTLSGDIQQQGTVTTAPAVGSTVTESGGVNSVGVPVFGGGGSGGSGMNTGRPLVPLAPMTASSEQVGGVVQ